MAKRKKPYDVLEEIPFGKKPKVLLVGNGISRDFLGGREIDQIIQDQWRKHYEEELPERGHRLIHHDIWKEALPLQVVIATKDHVSSCMNELANEFRKCVHVEEQIDLVHTLLSVNVDAVLSTNYSLEFEKSTIDNISDRKIYNQYRITQEQTSQQEQFGIYQCTEIPHANRPLLWHIHGTALRKKSMVMGQFYYGKLLSEIVQRSNQVLKEYKKTLVEKSSYIPKSWVDYFLIGDVYCLGFGMDLSETDLWWLISFKKDAFPDSSFTLYERSQKSGIRELLYDAYGIKVISTPELRGGSYIEFYKNVCADIKTKNEIR